MKQKIKKIAVLTSGGDAPGMNAAIRAVVRTACALGIEVYGIRGGFRGLTNGDFYTEKNKLVEKTLEKYLEKYHFVAPPIYETETMQTASVSQIIGKGGTILLTSRFEEFTNANVRAIAIENLRKEGIEGLVVIGGNGSYQGAHLIAQEAPDIQVIGIPATIDNDIAWTTETIGFDTASNTLSKHCDNIRSTAKSHQRIFVVGAMGRKAGDLALRAGRASGAEAILLPEFPCSDEQLIKMLKTKMSDERTYALVVVAEGVGTPDEIAEKLKKAGYEVKTSDIGHAQRGGVPTNGDRILADSMGYHAVKFLEDGLTDKAVSFDGKIYTAVDFEKIFTEPDVVKHRILAGNYRQYQKITHGEVIVPTDL
ncbi:MAG: ATP-dependent 6-phosphofructokinase [candidate division SR1 bacterium]|jgi:6-phosphofructokinase|nr:ATP-dependent 6-phosphofructokinase [candidate division SR1 bacterium]